MTEEQLNRAREIVQGEKCYPDAGRTIYGPAYQRHVNGMTREGLHSKADIAEQFALRDDTIAALLAERDAKLMTKLGQFKTCGDPAIDGVLAASDPEFRAWVASMPEQHWAKYDLSALRIGWHYGRKPLMAENERLTAAFQRAHDQAYENGTRAHDAESRLRALCEQEPVAWAAFEGTEIKYMEMSDGSGADIDLPGNGFIPLIPRPEMPK